MMMALWNPELDCDIPDDWIRKGTEGSDYPVVFPWRLRVSLYSIELDRYWHRMKVPRVQHALQKGQELYVWLQRPGSTDLLKTISINIEVNRSSLNICIKPLFPARQTIYWRTMLAGWHKTQTRAYELSEKPRQIIVQRHLEGLGLKWVVWFHISPRLMKIFETRQELFGFIYPPPPEEGRRLFETAQH